MIMKKFVNIADLTDPNDNQSRTYREVNNSKKHNFECGQLVEIKGRFRLEVTRKTRDCDGTPLYFLGLEGQTLIRGYSEDCLKAI
jgi:hypothetical protein